MDTNSEISQYPRDPQQEGERVGTNPWVSTEEGAIELVPESGLPNLNILIGLEELFPGFIELVLVRIPEIRSETLASYLPAALQEVATELGKEKLAGIVATKAVLEPSLPNLQPLMKLNELWPDFIERVFVRMQEIQQQIHQNELDTPQEPVRRKFGKTITAIFKKNI